VKRANSVLFIALIVLVGAALAACKPSPKARADEFVRYLPGEVGDWEREDKDTVKLLSSTITNMGHVIMIYEGADDAIAYITVEAHPSIDSAELALTNRERELLLDGLELDKDRQPPKATALVAQRDRVRYALFQEDEVVVEINAIAADDENPVSDEAFDELLTIVRNAYEKLAEK